MFRMTINNKPIFLPLKTSEDFIVPRKKTCVPVKPTDKEKQQRIISFSIAHHNDYLKDISEKIKNDCSSDIPNAY